GCSDRWSGNLTRAQEPATYPKADNAVMCPQKENLPPKRLRRYAHSVGAIGYQVMGKDEQWVLRGHPAMPILHQDPRREKQQRVEAELPGRATTVSSAAVPASALAHAIQL